MEECEQRILLSGRCVAACKNNKEEVLAIILTTGYGTSIRESELKLLTENFSQVMSVDPVLAVKSRLSYSATAEAGKRIFQFTLDGVTRTFEYMEEDAGFWLDQPALGNMVRYYVEGGILYASVPIQVSPGEFPVAVRLRYEYDGTAFLVTEAMYGDVSQRDQGMIIHTTNIDIGHEGDLFADYNEQGPSTHL